MRFDQSASVVALLIRKSQQASRVEGAEQVPFTWPRFRISSFAGWEPKPLHRRRRLPVPSTFRARFYQCLLSFKCCQSTGENVVMDARSSMQKWRHLVLGVVVAWLASVGWTNAQTTESVRLYGTLNANRNYPYDNAYSYGSGTNRNNRNNVTSRNQDTIYWERTREQMRSQYAANTDRYSPNWGANDRVDSRSQSGSFASGSFNSGPYNSGTRNTGSGSGSGSYDGLNQNFQSDYNSKVPSFTSGSGSYVRPSS